MAQVAMIGRGTIGGRAIAVAPNYGYEVALVVGQDGVRTASGRMLSRYNVAAELAEMCKRRRITRALLAIPSGGTGALEAGFITALAGAGCKIVTAGKSALANQFDLIKPHMSTMGFDATVGGGTMIPTFLRDHLYVNGASPFVFTGAINGTLNYGQTRVTQDAGAEQIVDESLRLGFAEPAENGELLTMLKMYQGEFPDISRKLAILGNTRLRKIIGRTVTQEDFKRTVFTEDDLARVAAGNSTYRYLVRVCTNQRDLEFFSDIDIGGSIKVCIGGVWFAAGFVKLEGALQKWVPDHVGNAAHLKQGGDIDIKKGQGAGPVPTVGAMYANLRSFDEAA